MSTSDPQTVELTTTLDEKFYGQRLDQALASVFSDYSRSRLQQWIKAGQVLVDEQPVTSPKHKLRGCERIDVKAQLEREHTWEARELPLNLLYEDEDILIVDKPADLVVHPAAGHKDDTLVNALLHHAPELAQLPRAGIVHRLDKDTTGALVVARNLTAHKNLVEALQLRDFDREYQCIVLGTMVAGGTVEAPIGRHPVKRKQMAVVASGSGKEAITHYRVLDKFRAHTHVQVKLETGRTHQIRVHMAHIQHPLVGDPLYGGRLKLPKAASDEFKQSLRQFNRQALHAVKLGLQHPRTGQYMEWQSPLPEDFVQLLQVLEQDRQDHG